MPTTPYPLASLVPPGLYATQVWALISATRDLFVDAEALEFSREGLDAGLRHLSDSQTIRSNDYFKVLRVALCWPDATPDLFEAALALGRDGVRRHLELALTRLTDVAGH